MQRLPSRIGLSAPGSAARSFIARHPVLMARAGMVLAGVAGATGFQPLAFWPATLVAVAWLIHKTGSATTARHAALLGWLFGVGHFTLGNNWIATAFTYQAEMPVWLGWVAVVLLALYLAIYPALATLGGWWLARRWKAALVPAFAGCWIIAEWLRSWVFTGFAWNPLGMVTLGGFDRPGLALVVAPWLGTYAVSGLVVLFAGLWLGAVRAALTRRWAFAALCGAVPAGLLVLPLHGAFTEGTLAFTLVQPNTGQDEINDPAKYESQFQRTAGLSLSPDPARRRLVLWPESGVPDYLRPGYSRYWYADTYGADPDLARARIGRVIGPRSLLFTGAIDLALSRGQVVGGYNVVTALDGTGAIRGSYAKAHLVPYGEYLPMRALLEPLGLSRLSAGTLDFFSGPGPRTLDFGAVKDGGWGKAGFQICYEIVFSGRVTDRALRPDYIFNPSIDGWFGSWGPPQHLAQARMRALEEGLPVLRSTTTGISAVIDADGKVRQYLPSFRAGRLDGLVPPAHAPTLFARWGNALGLCWGMVLLVIALVASRVRGR